MGGATDVLCGTTDALCGTTEGLLRDRSPQLFGRWTPGRCQPAEGNGRGMRSVMTSGATAARAAPGSGGGRGAVLRAGASPASGSAGAGTVTRSCSLRLPAFRSLAGTGVRSLAGYVNVASSEEESHAGGRRCAV